MGEVTLKEGDVVVHYKRYHLFASDLHYEPNKYLYKIIGLAYNCTTEAETMVVYQALYKPYILCVRTVGDFCSILPEEGRHRFEKWNGEVAE
jgi:hypothetical protein